MVVDNTPPFSPGGQDSEKLIIEINGYHFSKGCLHPRSIPLARELPYTLFVNDREILSISTLPTHLEELFVGFLVAEGVLINKSELKEVHVDNPSRIVRMEIDAPSERLGVVLKKGMLTSGCAGGMVFSVQSSIHRSLKQIDITRVKISSVLERMKELDTFTGTYRVTKGVHAAGPSQTRSLRSRFVRIWEDIALWTKSRGGVFLMILKPRTK